MGLIKTAIISGAALYGVNKLTQAAQQHQVNNNNGYMRAPPSQRRDINSYDSDTEGYPHPSSRQVQDDHLYDSQNRAGQDASGPANRKTHSGYYRPDPLSQSEHPSGNRDVSQGQDARQFNNTAQASAAPPSYGYYDPSQRGLNASEQYQSGGSRTRRSKSAEVMDLVSELLPQAGKLSALVGGKK